jgi:hypothetical protein
MRLATPAFRPGKIGKALEAVKAHLRTPGTDLYRGVNLWQLQDGLDTDDIQPADWTLEQLPALRLDIQGGPADWFNQVTSKTHVSYAITLGVQGVNPSAGTDFFEVLVSRLWPGDGSLHKALKPLGVMSYSIVGTGFEPITKPSGRAQIVHSRFTLYHEIHTQV